MNHDFSKISYNQVNSMAERLKEASGQMETTLQEITNLLKVVGDENTWSGTAAEATKAEFEALSSKFPEFANAIKDCGLYLNQVIANYQAVDKIAQIQD